jgi:hypothetical protein
MISFPGSEVYRFNDACLLHLMHAFSIYRERKERKPGDDRQ